MEMIKAIIFDLANVIIEGTLRFENLLEPILGIPKEKLIWKWKIPEFYDLLYGKISEKTYWEKVIEKNNWDVSVEALEKVIRQHFKEIKGTREIIIKLKQKDFKLAILSGHIKEWITYLNEKYDFEKYFDYCLYSYQTGFNKPDKRMYEKIIEKLQVKPEESIFIDDVQKFLEPAKEMGIKVIHFRSAEQLLEDLEKLGIKLN